MKLHVNSNTSDVKVSYMFIELKYFYLNNIMDRTEYYGTYTNDTTDFFGQIQPPGETHNGYIYTRVTNRMYGLPQSRRISHYVIRLL